MQRPFRPRNKPQPAAPEPLALKGNYAFIDSQNLNLGVQKFGWKMDWRKFRQFLGDKYGVTKAFMFIGYVPEFEPLYEQMHELGFNIVLKPTFDMTRPPRPEITPEQAEKDAAEGKPEEEKKPIKGNIDAELVLWSMRLINEYDKAIIVSDDGDFYSLVEYLEEQGKLLHLLAPTQHYSQLYNRFDKYIVQLGQFKRELAYFDYKKRNKR
jgi:uncharacterized LabA/DUF88 family protein